MGYITTALTAAERERAGPKDGAAAGATVSIDPVGSITVLVASVPQGQGHRTVLAQVVAEALGVELDDVTVNVEHDTQKDPWSIAAGNYSSRFSGAVAGAAHLAAAKLRERRRCRTATDRKRPTFPRFPRFAVAVVSRCRTRATERVAGSLLRSAPVDRVSAPDHVCAVRATSSRPSPR